MDDTVLSVIAVLAVLVVIGGGFAYIASSRLEVGMTIVDPDTKGYDQCIGHGLDPFTRELRGFGHFPDLPGDAVGRGEIFSTTRAWYAWFLDGESRPVAVQARLKDCPDLVGFTTPPDNVYYRYSINNGDGTWRGFVQDRLPEAAYHSTLDIPNGAIDIDLAAHELIIDGYQYRTCTDWAGLPYCPAANVDKSNRTIKDGAALKVEVYLERRGTPGSWSYVLIAEDQVELRSALPDVGWNRGGYDVGETALVDWRIPIDQDEAGDPAYFLSIINANTNTPLAGYDRRALNGTSGQERIVIAQMMFSNDLATCANRLRAEILSQIILADLADATVRSPDVTVQAGAAPSVTGVTFDKPEYQEGDTVAIAWTVSGNVTKVHVTAHIGGLVVFDRDLPGDARSASFVAPRTGVLEVEVTAYDRCTASDVRKEQATVGNVYPGLCELYPDAPQCSERNVWALVLAIVGVILVVVAFLAALWVVSRFKVPALVLFLGPVLAAGLTAIGLLAAGWFDPFLGAA